MFPLWNLWLLLVVHAAGGWRFCGWSLGLLLDPGNSTNMLETGGTSRARVEVLDILVLILVLLFKIETRFTVKIP